MFDRMADLQEMVQRQLLDRTEPPSHVTAREQFAKAGISYKRIVKVNPEAILYVGDDGRAWTAWCEVRDNGKTIAFYRYPGFEAMTLWERAGFSYEDRR